MSNAKNPRAHARGSPIDCVASLFISRHALACGCRVLKASRWRQPAGSVRFANQCQTPRTHVLTQARLADSATHKPPIMNTSDVNKHELAIQPAFKKHYSRSLSSIIDYKEYPDGQEEICQEESATKRATKKTAKKTAATRTKKKSASKKVTAKAKPNVARPSENSSTLERTSVTCDATQQDSSTMWLMSVDRFPKTVVVMRRSRPSQAKVIAAIETIDPNINRSIVGLTEEF